MNRRTAVPLTLFAMAGLALVAPPAVAAPPALPTVATLGDALPLGPAGLEETRTTQTLQPGVTLTRIVRGHTDPSAVWTVEVAIPSGPGSPDPDAPPAAIRDEVDARATGRQAPPGGSRSTGREGQYATARGLLRRPGLAGPSRRHRDEGRGGRDPPAGDCGRVRRFEHLHRLGRRAGRRGRIHRAVARRRTDHRPSDLWRPTRCDVRAGPRATRDDEPARRADGCRHRSQRRLLRARPGSRRARRPGRRGRVRRTAGQRADRGPPGAGGARRRPAHLDRAAALAWRGRRPHA